jgi:holliday junction DNA helicase RuvB
MDQKLMRDVLRIAEVEDALDQESFEYRAGWRCRDVDIWPATLQKLRMEGLVKDGYESNSYHGYFLTGKARTLLAGYEYEDEGEQASGDLEIPVDLFEDIIGHDDIKELLRACLQAEKPVHVLLTGPPALAKSLFLWDIEHLPGSRAEWLIGSGMSKSGLWDLVAERRPRHLLVDELDKVGAADTSALLSLMEGGRLVRVKSGRELDIQVDIRVVAATNVDSKLSPELRSRFAIRRLMPYSREDYRQVVRGVMVRKEGILDDQAREIAARLDGRTQDVRDAVRVARLVPALGVERAVDLLLPRN